MTTDWLPFGVELTYADHDVDLHPLHFRPDGSAWHAGLDTTRFDCPIDDWPIGRIGDRPVICLSPTRQRLFHSGYDHSEIDCHDMVLLDRPRSAAQPPTHPIPPPSNAHQGVRARRFLPQLAATSMAFKAVPARPK